ncbi:hypothetical protein [Anoxybacter fermentans]|nr:hypothetical protein [Anoxybacter fermentans]
MILNLGKYIASGNVLLTVLGVIIFLLEIWMIEEAWNTWHKYKTVKDGGK